MRSLTSSTIGRAALCPASAALPVVSAVRDRVGIRKGSCIHRFLEVAAQRGQTAGMAEVDRMIADDPKLPRWVRGACASFPAEEILGQEGAEVHAEVSFIYDAAVGTASCLGKSIERQYGEHSLSAIPGTTDWIVLRPGRRPWVIEFKTYDDGTEAEEHDQLGWAALCVYTSATYRHWQELLPPGERGIDASLCRIDQDGEARYNHARFGEDEFAALRRRFLWITKAVHAARSALAAGTGPDMAVGDQCRWCPCFKACPAQVALLRGAGALDVLSERLGSLSPEQVGRAAEFVNRYLPLLEALKEAVRAYAHHHNQPIALPGGAEEVYALETHRSSVLYGEALPILVDRYGDAVADRAVKKSLDKTSIIEALGKTAAEEAFALLEAARAIVKTPVVQLRTRKVKPPKGSKAGRNTPPLLEG